MYGGFYGNLGEKVDDMSIYETANRQDFKLFEYLYDAFNAVSVVSYKFSRIDRPVKKTLLKELKFKKQINDTKLAISKKDQKVK